ncbi:transporter substrate-binding domain-containing protein [Hoeflea sp. G2-23]|uniref:Transporter substrate-binding domain-containing protein n=1 Tax=Hoeflea algicola TaxID=2983763 RepID=A0ABT3ZDQ6_9HYPH|nr:transporter substrate-binding domain-containing protein [Hoeflea algicola]MCY0149778.1 transporter substrate-binding domain-containing protein [Hoeflea algicola]
MAAGDVVVPNYIDPRERIPAPDSQSFNRIRFVTTVDFPPFSFFDQTNRLSGFHIDLARAICAEMNALPKCQIQALPWTELANALKTGQAEAMISGLAMTAKSRADYRFTRPYLQLPARFAIRKDAAPGGIDAKALAARRVGVVGGAAHEAMLREWFPALKPVTFSRPDWMFDALKSGNLDAVYGDGLQLSFWLSSQTAESCCRFFDGPYFSRAHLGEGLAIAVAPRNAALAVAFDNALAALNRDGRFAELYLRWFPNGLY